MKEFFVIIGNFGSGKTEFALNKAFKHAGEGKKVTLVDYDVINPYFRSTERKTELEAAGVRLISPNFTTSGVEVPSIPAEIYSVFADDSDIVIFDVGGDPVGAIALGMYNRYFKELEHLEVWYVINMRRPLSSGVAENLEMIDKIKGVSRLDITGIINNTNLAHETTVADIVEGMNVTNEVARLSGLPVVATLGTAEVLADFEGYVNENSVPAEKTGRLIPIERYMHRDWGRYTDRGL